MRCDIDGCGLTDDPKAPLFRTISRGTAKLSDNAMTQPDADAMIRRRAAAAKIDTEVGSHSSGQPAPRPI